MAADIVIRGGTVIDGSGGPGRLVDIAITNGRVSAIERGLTGEVSLDATAQVVAPGFIDIHTHYDAQVLWDPALTPSSYHGVTTVIAGNCGFSIAPTRPSQRDVIARTLENVEDMDVDALRMGIPWEFETFPEYLGSVERRGTLLNFGAYIGHTALRLFVMGDDAYAREATSDEIGEMVQVVGEAMAAGAVGFSTSFAPAHRGADGLPVPSRFAAPGEFEILADAIGAIGRGVISLAPGEQCPVDRLYELQPRLGIPVTYGALLSSPTGAHERQLEVNRVGWAKGAQVWPQVTPRPLTFQFSMAAPFVFNVNAVFGEIVSASTDVRRKAYADPEWRRRAADALDTQAMPIRWHTFAVDETISHPELLGRSVAELAAERCVHPLEVLLDAALEEPDLAVRVRCVLLNDDTEAVTRLLQEDHCTLGLSDAGAHVGQLCDAPQATDFLGAWVRDRGVMPLEQAIRKLTGVQADLFGFEDRGYLRVGAWADVVVFDPQTVGSGPIRRVRDFPAGSARLTADAPTGITHVLVNGVPIRRDGAMVEQPSILRPGQIVKPRPR